MSRSPDQIMREYMDVVHAALVARYGSVEFMHAVIEEEDPEGFEERVLPPKTQARMQSLHKEFVDAYGKEVFGITDESPDHMRKIALESATRVFAKVFEDFT